MNYYLDSFTKNIEYRWYNNFSQEESNSSVHKRQRSFNVSKLD